MITSGLNACKIGRQSAEYSSGPSHSGGRRTAGTSPASSPASRPRGVQEELERLPEMPGGGLRRFPGVAGNPCLQPRGRAVCFCCTRTGSGRHGPAWRSRSSLAQPRREAAGDPEDLRPAQRVGGLRRQVRRSQAVPVPRTAVCPCGGARTPLPVSSRRGRTASGRPPAGSAGFGAAPPLFVPCPAGRLRAAGRFSARGHGRGLSPRSARSDR